MVLSDKTSCLDWSSLIKIKRKIKPLKKHFGKVCVGGPSLIAVSSETYHGDRVPATEGGPSDFRVILNKFFVGLSKLYFLKTRD